MTSEEKKLYWVFGNLASVPCVLIGSFFIFNWIVSREYEAGLRSPSDGDIVLLPAIGLAVMWGLFLLLLNAVLSLVKWNRERKTANHPLERDGKHGGVSR